MFCSCFPDGDVCLQEDIPPSTGELTSKQVNDDEQPKTESAPMHKSEESTKQTAAEGRTEAEEPVPAEVVSNIQEGGQERRSANAANMFEIVVSRSGPDKGWGLDTIAQRQPVQLLVSAVRPGVIEKWNAANPTKVVSPGDAIKAINGESSDIDRLYAHMARARRLRVQIQRG